MKVIKIILALAFLGCIIWNGFIIQIGDLFNFEIAPMSQVFHKEGGVM